jgi:VWFA-related protein
MGKRTAKSVVEEDFQLYDNNKLQTITAFGIEDAESRKERRDAATTQPTNGETDTQASEALPQRFIALTFDDVHLETGDIAPMKIAANAFIDSIAPSDRVGFFTTSGVVTQDFTSNKQLLKEALSKVISHVHPAPIRSGCCPSISYNMAVQVQVGNGASALLNQQTRSCAPELSPAALQDRLDAELMRALSEGDAENLNAYRELEGVLGFLSSKPGERVLLFVSPGFLIASSHSELSSEFVDHANRSSIVINAIDARGLDTPDLFGDIGQQCLQPPQTVGQRTELSLRIQMDKPMVLADFAEGTGGIFFHSSNDLEGGLKQLGIAPEVSYLLGFSPRLLKTDGQFHTIKVTLTGKQNYAVQARRGYLAPKKLEDPAEIAKEEIREAVFSSDEIVGSPFTMQTQYLKSSAATAQLAVVARVDLNGTGRDLSANAT